MTLIMLTYSLHNFNIFSQFCQENLSMFYKILTNAKYKPNTRSVRADTHQLLSYVLLAGVKKCGFAFPGAESKAKIMRSTETAALPLSVNAINYYELIFGNDSDNAAEVLKTILP